MPPPVKSESASRDAVLDKGDPASCILHLASECLGIQLLPHGELGFSGLIASIITTREALPARSRMISRSGGRAPATSALAGHSRHARLPTPKRPTSKSITRTSTPSLQISNGGSAQAMSKLSPRSRSSLDAATAERTRSSARSEPRLKEAAFFSISCAADRCRSTKTTDRAPRERASRPTAPVPANRSKKRESMTRSPRTPNARSRIESGVGRRPLFFPGPCSRRDRHSPAVILTDRFPRRGE